MSLTVKIQISNCYLVTKDQLQTNHSMILAIVYSLFLDQLFVLLSFLFWPPSAIQLRQNDGFCKIENLTHHYLWFVSLVLSQCSGSSGSSRYKISIENCVPEIIGVDDNYFFLSFFEKQLTCQQPNCFAPILVGS